MSTNWLSEWVNGADDGWLLTWLGTDDVLTFFPGYGPEGAATFAYELDQGYTLALRWPTNANKMASGREQRESRNDRVKQRYTGNALLLGLEPVALRALLARYASRAPVFLLGLPHEELLLSADASGTTVYVSAADLALTDWKNPGQRVVLVREDANYVLQSINAVVQSTAANSITLDVAPGAIGLAGGRIMPAKAIYLESQQDFARYPQEAESWNLRARAAVFDFAMDLAVLDLGPLTLAAGLNGATLTARNPGATVWFSMSGGLSSGIQISESAPNVLITFSPSDLTGTPSTVTDLYNILATSTLLKPTGTWGTGNLSTADNVPLTAMTAAATAGPVGLGATLVEHVSRPVWDRELRISTTATDGIQAMTEILDYDGIPYGIGLADQADWYRAVAIASERRSEWQWLKLFMATVRGAQRAFWLSTYRNDLPFVSKATNVITVTGDVAAWYPAQRQHVEVRETSGTITRAQIAAAVNNGNGTFTLTIGVTLASSSVERVSWLELCRFEKEDFSVTWGAHGFSMSTIARVVVQ